MNWDVRRQPVVLPLCRQTDVALNASGTHNAYSIFSKTVITMYVHEVVWFHLNYKKLIHHVHSCKNKGRWRAKLSEFLLSSIVLKRNAAPEGNVVIACWMGALQTFSIILKLTSAAVTAITFKAIPAQLILPAKVLPKCFLRSAMEQ